MDTPHCETHVDFPADYTLRASTSIFVMIEGINFYAFGKQWLADPLQLAYHVDCTNK